VRYLVPLLLCLGASPAWASPANGPFSFPNSNQNTLPYANTAKPQSSAPGYSAPTQQQNTQTQAPQQQGNQPGGFIPQAPVIPANPEIFGTPSTTNSPATTQPATTTPGQSPTPAQNPTPAHNISSSRQQSSGGAGGAGGAGGTGGAGGVSGQKGPDISGLSNIVGKIFSSGQDIAEQNKRKAQEKEKEKQVREELQKKIEYMGRNNYRRETMPEAIYKKQYEEGNQHLPKVVYESDYDGLLFGCIESGDSDALRSVIIQGRSLEVRNRDGDTPLLYATLIGNVDAARILLEHGADVDAQNLKNGVNALQIAAFIGSEELARLLLEMDADPSIKNAYGKTALQLAEAKSNYGVALLILARLSELKFSGGQEEIKRLHRRQEDKRERELRAENKMPTPNPTARVVKESAAEVPPVPQPKPEEKKPLLPLEKEESVKERIQRFLANLTGREQEQQKQVAEKKQKENKRAEEFIETNAPPPMPSLSPEPTVPLSPPPAPVEGKPAPVLAAPPPSQASAPAVVAPTLVPSAVPAAIPNVPSAPAPSEIIFKRSTPSIAKFFIPDSLFSEAIEGEIKPQPAAPAATPEKLPGEDEPLPTSPPKIDLLEVINSLPEASSEVPEGNAPAISSPVISERKSDTAVQLPANNSASPGQPLRSSNPANNGSVPPLPAITPLQVMPADKNSVMIPPQPGINQPLPAQ